MSTVKENFNQISPSEFFYRNRDLAGFSNPTRSLYTAVREFVENALDACDQQSILPNVHLSIKAVEPEKQDPKMYILSVKDNGPGIESKYIPKAFQQFYSQNLGLITGKRNVGFWSISLNFLSVTIFYFSCTFFGSSTHGCITRSIKCIFNKFSLQPPLYTSLPNKYLPEIPVL